MPEPSQINADSVRIVLFDAADPARFLLLTEADDRDNWKLPGGKFNHTHARRETPGEAAQRELAEEAGLSTPLQQVAQLINDDGVSARYIFRGSAGRDQIHPTAEVARVRWVTEADLPDTKNRQHILSAVDVARRG